MSESNPTLWELIKDFFIPVGGPAIGGLLGYLAAKQKNDILDNHLDAKGDAIQLDAITRHFEALIDGYEKRINDLTNEVHQLRDEVKKLRQALDARARSGMYNG